MKKTKRSKTKVVRKTRIKPAKKAPRLPKKDSILDLAKIAARSAEEAKAIDTQILDIRGLASFADYLVICGGTNTRQVASIADRIDEKISGKLKKNPLGIEGKEAATWILMDYGDVVCHIFMEEQRHLYRLEDLWHSAKRVKY